MRSTTPLIPLILAASVAAAVAACTSGGSGDEPEPDATPLVPVLVPSEETTGFIGEAIAFDFPSNWFIVTREFDAEEGRETIVVANVERDVGPRELPVGGIRVEFTAEDAQPPEEEVPGEVVDQFALNGVRFIVREGEGIPWTVMGRFTIGGVNYGYRAEVQMNTAEPDTDPIKPLLQSWVVGSTNNHPQRTCISPVKCPD